MDGPLHRTTTYLSRLVLCHLMAERGWFSLENTESQVISLANALMHFVNYTTLLKLPLFNITMRLR